MSKLNEHLNSRKTLGSAAKAKLTFSLNKLVANLVEDKPSISERALKVAAHKELEQNYARLRNAARVLNHWHSNAEYLDDRGDPISLPKTGRISLSSLVTAALGSSRGKTTTLQDLTSFGLMEKSREGHRPKKRSAVYGSKSSIMLAHATSAIDRLIETISHNVSGAPLPRYERQVSAVRIAERELPQFLRFVEQQGQYFIDSIDDWLAAREVTKTSNESTIAVGVGAYAWTESRAEKVKKTATRSKPSTRPRR